MADCKDLNRNLEYARAYIVPQKFENLYSLDEALENGTLYEDLYRPYVEKRDNKRKVNFRRD